MENYQHRDYLRMVITGLIYHNDYLPSYLRREQKKAEKDYIEFSEFIGRTITVVKDLEGEFRRLKDQKKNELEANKDGENDKSINKQIENLSVAEGFSLPLEVYTDGEFKGHINIWDISKVRDAINAAFDFYSIEKEDENNEPREYFIENKNEEVVDEKLTNKAPHVNPYPEVFKSLEALLLFQRLHESKKSSQTLLADFSFIYRRMYKDDLLQDYQKPEVFRQWLSKEPFEVVLDNPFKTLDNCTTKNKEDDYHNAKLLVQMQTE